MRRRRLKKNPSPLMVGGVVAGVGIAALILYRRRSTSTAPTAPKRTIASLVREIVAPKPAAYAWNQDPSGGLSCMDLTGKLVPIANCASIPKPALSGLAGPHGGHGHHGHHGHHHHHGRRGGYVNPGGPWWGWGPSETVYVVDAGRCVDSRTGVIMPPWMCGY